AARFDPEAGRRRAGLQPPQSPVVPVAHREVQPANTPAPAPDPLPPARPLDGVPSLTAEDAVRVVFDRNPTLEQMRATAAAAAARYPQVSSLDDPMFSFSTAPGSAWSPNTTYAARVELTQKLPFPGKRDLKGAAAQAEAAAAIEDIEDA